MLKQEEKVLKGRTGPYMYIHRWFWFLYNFWSEISDRINGPNCSERPFGLTEWKMEDGFAKTQGSFVAAKYCILLTCSQEEKHITYGKVRLAPCLAELTTGPSLY